MKRPKHSLLFLLGKDSLSRFESLVVWLTVNFARIVSIQFRIEYLSAYIVLVLSAYSLVS